MNLQVVQTRARMPYEAKSFQNPHLRQAPVALKPNLYFPNKLLKPFGLHRAPVTSYPSTAKIPKY